MKILGLVIDRVRRWPLWRHLGLVPPAPDPALAAWLLRSTASIGREVSGQGVRVYSLCGRCGVPLTASATLCDPCARARSRPTRSA